MTFVSFCDSLCVFSVDQRAARWTSREGGVPDKEGVFRVQVSSAETCGVSQETDGPHLVIKLRIEGFDVCYVCLSGEEPSARWGGVRGGYGG